MDQPAPHINLTYALFSGKLLLPKARRAAMSEPLIFELSSPGRKAFTLPPLDVPPSDLPKEYLRDELPLPEVSEVDVVRHYLRLSQLNFAVDKGFYPCLLYTSPSPRD